MAFYCQVKRLTGASTVNKTEVQVQFFKQQCTSEYGSPEKMSWEEMQRDVK